MAGWIWPKGNSSANVPWRALGVPKTKPFVRWLDGAWHVDYGEPYPLIRCEDFGWAMTVVRMTRSVSRLREIAPRKP